MQQWKEKTGLTRRTIANSGQVQTPIIAAHEATFGVLEADLSLKYKTCLPADDV
jgi:hypothetical protein